MSEIKKTQIFILRLRSQPIGNLSDEAVRQILKTWDFYDYRLYRTGRGVNHQYKSQEINSDKIVFDHTTGLMWQQGGSKGYMNYKMAKNYIRALNDKQFAGFEDWRLPTLEEAMSLMEATQNKDNGLYIAVIFDIKQEYIWTSDLNSTLRAWGVGFGVGRCRHSDIGGDYYVRAVRSAH